MRVTTDTPAAAGPSRRVSRYRFDLAALALVLCAHLSGCHVPGPVSPVPDVVAAAVLAALRAKRDSATKAENLHKGFFIFRRAQVLAEIQPSFLNQSDHADLIAQVGKDCDEVQAFVNGVFSGSNSLSLAAPDGPSKAALSDPFTCASDKHIDLNNVSAKLVGIAAAQKDVQAFLTLRNDSARAIIWRAAAIHGKDDPDPTNPKNVGLWDNTAKTDRLRIKRLQEVLDRRLRATERMNTQVNAFANVRPFRRARRRGATSGSVGPWDDKTRVRMLEYPFFDVNKSTDLIDDKGIFWEVPDPPHDKRITWNWRSGSVAHPDRVIPTRLDPEPVAQGTPTLNTTWLVVDDDWAYSRAFTSVDASSPTLDAAITTLMQPAIDIWRRGWLYCDHVCSVLELEALRFALLRRVQEPGIRIRSPCSTESVSRTSSILERTSARLRRIPVLRLPGRRSIRTPCSRMEMMPTGSTIYSCQPRIFRSETSSSSGTTSCIGCSMTVRFSLKTPWSSVSKATLTITA